MGASLADPPISRRTLPSAGGRLRRPAVPLRDFLLVALVAIAAYGIISQLADIGFRTIYDQLRRAEWAWVALALMTAQLTFVTQAVSTRGAVRTPLPLLPVVALH